MVKLWHALGSLKLAFWLLMGATVILFTGSLYTSQHYALFNTLNEMPLHIWLAAHIKSDIEFIWWLPLLLVVMTLLGINIFICAWNRMFKLFEKKNKMAGNRFIVKLMPSIIHFLFLIIITGHLITFTLSSWVRIPLQVGDVVHIGENASALSVQSIDHKYFPDHSGLNGRVEQTQVVLSDEVGRNIQLSFLEPVVYNGTILQLDMRPDKQKIEDKKPKQNIDPENKETCNKAHVYHVQPEKADKQLMLLSVSDPGLYIIISAFTVILILMTWYFVSLSLARRKAMV